MYRTMHPGTVVITPRRNEAEKSFYIRESTARYIASASLFPVMSGNITGAEYIESVCAAASGIVFEGGGDILPRFYGEDGEENCRDTDRTRDEFELALCRAAYLRGIPMLGICRGAQIIAVALGGTLCRHVDGHSDGVMHQIHINGGSRNFSKFAPASAVVNSYHHQSVKSLPSLLSVAAKADDGTVEAIEGTTHPFCVGVQWHPELMPESKLSRALLWAFRRAVLAYKEKNGFR